MSPVFSLSPTAPAPVEREFLVVCLCAAWCGTCRDYAAGFHELALAYPAAAFLWVDIEDEDSGVEDWDIENFPTVLIQRNEHVLFCGPLLPHHRILKQMLDVYFAQSEGESRAYAHATPERAAWQARFNYREILRHR